MTEPTYAALVLIAWLALGYGAFVLCLVLMGFVEGLLERRRR